MDNLLHLIDGKRLLTKPSIVEKDLENWWKIRYPSRRISIEGDRKEDVLTVAERMNSFLLSHLGNILGNNDETAENVHRALNKALFYVGALVFEAPVPKSYDYLDPERLLRVIDEFDLDLRRPKDLTVEDIEAWGYGLYDAFQPPEYYSNHPSYETIGDVFDKVKNSYHYDDANFESQQQHYRANIDSAALKRNKKVSDFFSVVPNEA
jgi:hypothetical protein